MFFLPLKLDLAISSRPNIASFARATVNDLKLATSFPGLSFRTCSTVDNLGGVSNGGGPTTSCSSEDEGVVKSMVGDSTEPKLILGDDSGVVDTLGLPVF